MDEWKVVFTGDVICTQWDLQNNRNFEKWFEDIKDCFTGAEWVITNLETPIAGEKMLYTYEPYQFNTPMELPMAMKKAGFNLVATCNNHCLDRGAEGLIATIKNLDNIGLQHTGTFLDKSVDKRYEIINVGTWKIGVLSVTYGTNAQENHNYLYGRKCGHVNLIQSQELKNIFVRRAYRRPKSIHGKIYFKLFQRFAKQNAGKLIHERIQNSFRQRRHLKYQLSLMRKEVDFIVVLLHDGSQFKVKPCERKLNWIHWFKKEGADIVIANHEHVVSGIKCEKDFFATYALGDVTGAQGIKVPPYGKKAEYSIILNAYFKESDKQVRYTFTIIKREVMKDGSIVPVRLYDLYERSSDASVKRKLYWMNIKLYNIVTQKNVTKLPVKKEYEINYGELSDFK